jgi:ABC-2 type transport system ATP-binding protein
MTKIHVSHLAKSYGKNAALGDVSFDVESGEIFGLIGPDGAGKTTLIRILCSLVDFDSGEVSLCGLDTRCEASVLKARVGYMPQRFSLYPDLSVAENIRFFADLYQVKRRDFDDRLKELLDFSKLGPFAKRRAGKLSGGMKQKLALCCTLIHTPEVLILDEPTTGVDPVSRLEFWEILERLSSEGVTILVSTPYMDEALRCNHIALINKGYILATDTPQNLPTLFTGQILEIEGEKLFDFAKKCRSLASVSSVHLFGGRLHIVTDDAEVCRDDIANATGLSPERIHRAEPSIEDTFINLLEAK